ncbi:MAG: hypothetical protein M3Q75_03510 [Gemmatimonadota bacterium]|nr:hypothetical protein [Gemmatimonadota bacterium]
MMKLFATLFLFAVALMLAPAAHAAADPVACTGYPETRQFVDAQSWWEQTGGAEPRHLHVGACVPEREQLTGTVRIDLKVQMHANPGKVTYVAIVWETGYSGDHTYQSFNPGWTCPVGNCVFWTAFDIPVSAWDRAGLNGLRLRATARQPDGKEMRASLNLQNYIANGKTVSNMTRRPYLRAKGWFTGLNYCEAAYRSDVTPLPDAPVSGTWSPWIRQLDHGTSDADPTHHDVRLDPDIHAGVPGIFLLDGAGARDGLVAIDAAAGAHKLFAKTDCETSAGTASGVLVVPFAVE